MKIFLSTLLLSYSSAAFAAPAIECGGLVQSGSDIAPVSLQIRENKSNSAYEKLSGTSNIEEVASMEIDSKDKVTNVFSFETKLEGKMEIKLKETRGRTGLKDSDSFYGVFDFSQKTSNQNVTAHGLVECKHVTE